MAKAALKELVKKSQMMLGLLVTEWTKQGLNQKQILRKAKPYTDAIREASEELDRKPVVGRN